MRVRAATALERLRKLRGAAHRDRPRLARHLARRRERARRNRSRCIRRRTCSRWSTSCPTAMRPRLGKAAARPRRSCSTCRVHAATSARCCRCFRARSPSLDLSSYDLVMSISHAVAKGVRVHAAQLHVCYCHTPMRYAWDLRDTYLRRAALAAGWLRPLANPVLDRLRDWDRREQRGRHGVRRNLALHRRAHPPLLRPRRPRVIYPPVDTEFFTPPRTAPRARTRLFHCIALGPLQADRRHRRGVRARCPERRSWSPATAPTWRASALSRVGQRRVRRAMSRESACASSCATRARSCSPPRRISASLPLEAQACGTPVIAYGRGGARETIARRGASTRPGSSSTAIGRGDRRRACGVRSAVTPAIDAAACRRNAAAFSARALSPRNDRIHRRRTAPRRSDRSAADGPHRYSSRTPRCSRRCCAFSIRCCGRPSASCLSRSISHGDAPPDHYSADPRGGALAVAVVFPPVRPLRAAARRQPRRASCATRSAHGCCSPRSSAALLFVTKMGDTYLARVGQRCGC